MTRDDVLFHGKDLGDLIRSYEIEIPKEVNGWERDRILGTSQSDLVQYLVEKYTLDPPAMRRDDIHVESEGEVQINVAGRFDYGFGDRDGPHYVPGQFVTLAVPFEGDVDLFDFQPSSSYVGGVRGRVAGNRILITYQNVTLDAARTKRDIDSWLKQIDEILAWMKRDCDNWNKRVSEIAEGCINERKKRLLEQSNMVSALGLPVKRRDDTPKTFSVPVTRRRRPVALPAAPKESFKPEPALIDAEYDYILNVIGRLAITIERSPSTFASMVEEQIRDIILVDLNGHYEGDATGETFNRSGKTDILIRADGRNVFIAECKFWDGPKVLLLALDQILGYLTWRDTKAALIVFSKNVDFTNVLEGVRKAVAEHPNFKREIKQLSETHFRYLFRQKDDPARDLYLAVQVFNIPRRGAT